MGSSGSTQAQRDTDKHHRISSADILWGRKTRVNPKTCDKVSRELAHRVENKISDLFSKLSKIKEESHESNR